MEVAGIAIIAVIVLAFLAALAALVVLGFRLFMSQQQAYFKQLGELQATHLAEREKDRGVYEKFMSEQEAREQVLEQVDKEWVESPESVLDMDDDLKWEENPNG
jgi:hypothetical protein